ncbi:aspartate/glutamate racemase family protein [Rhodovulum euryhalinum]|uniref:Allantoin racemase n=1 Tax=Rhodovulum euryhalinum TaxID=35805 RepID=A0A4R2KER6_9RHOB|nr:aspartate/glutamate racemase family protein [Rhodovulum euryhalinum]TCO70802.1 allantoin racemase [Rhodovulum euryhalinum]
MSYVIINPNSTAAMTNSILAAAETAMPRAVFEGWTSMNGPPAIQGAADGEAATGPLLDLVVRASDRGARGIVIGCFDDTGLDEARRRAACPVLGIGQAAFHVAALRGWRFSVVTTLAVSVPIIEGNIRTYGFGPMLARVRASEVPVLALEEDPDAACARIAEEAQRAVAEDGIRAIIPGCAGMARLTGHLRATLPVPVIDGVESAARLIAAL